MKKNKLLIFMLLFIGVLLNPIQLYATQECLIIGQNIDPAKGRALFKKALENWHKGLKTKALQIYESSLIADSSILKHNDYGMALALLQKYRDSTATPTPGILCRQAFFENILIGNLETSISLYEKASKNGNKEIKVIAADEVLKLKEELKFIQAWQKEMERKIALERKKDLELYLKKDRLRNIDFEVSDNNFEIEELKERLEFLQNKEKEIAELIFSSMRKASRYRRRYYYPGAFQDSTPDPDTNTFPGGSWSYDGTMPNSQVPNPYAGFNNSNVSGRRALYRYYIYRGKTKRAQAQLDQIRAEIAGINQQIAKLDKSNKDLAKKRKEQNAPSQKKTKKAWYPSIRE